MRITAILGIRNEERYLDVILRHLVSNDIKLAIIDNESTDSTRDICAKYGEHVVYMAQLPYKGSFSLTDQLTAKAGAIKSIVSDWFIHQDADEILESPREAESLRQGIERVDAEGFSVINFDEFLFVPGADESFEYRDFYRSMRWYYFLQTRPQRLLRAWRHNPTVVQTEGGHRLAGEGLRVSPESFVLRHYPVLSLRHAREKYPTRTFAPEDVAKGWSRRRRDVKADDMRLPSKEFLKSLSAPTGKDFDKSDPSNKNVWELGSDLRPDA